MQMSDYRFLDNPRVTVQALVQALSDQCQSALVPGQHYLALQDTSEINLSAHRNRLNHALPGIGTVGNDQDLGFFIHPTLLINAHSCEIAGFSNVQIRTRRPHRSKERDALYRKLDIGYKESYKWLYSAEKTQEMLTQHHQHDSHQNTQNTQIRVKLTMVGDRESDIYEYFRRCPEDIQLLTRVRGERLVIDSSQNLNWAEPEPEPEPEPERKNRKGRRSTKIKEQKVKLYNLLNRQKVQGCFELPLEADSRKKRDARVALLEVRFTQVALVKPHNLRKNGEGEYDPLPVSAIEVREHPRTRPAGEEGILWRLFTTHSIQTFEQAVEAVRWYTLRWWIELFFATLKGGGLNLERSQLESGLAIQRLTLLAFPAALKVMQLQRGREDQESSSLKVFSAQEIDVLEILQKKLEGKTSKQKCSFVQGSMAWATWVIARLGGWKGYVSERPPGVRTLHLGLRKFETFFFAWNILKLDV